MSAFDAWLAKTQPMVAVGSAKGSQLFKDARLAMEVGWDAAVDAAADIAGKAATRAIESDGVGRASDRLAEVAQNIGALKTIPEERKS